MHNESNSYEIEQVCIVNETGMTLNRYVLSFKVKEERRSTQTNSADDSLIVI